VGNFEACLGRFTRFSTYAHQGRIAGVNERFVQAHKVNAKNFFAELKRRNVYKVAIAYAVVAWLVLQAASILFPTFEAPPWMMKIFVAVIALGFPIALVLGWAFELTPEGLKRTESADRESAKPSRNKAWIYVIIVAGAISIALFFLGRFTAAPRQTESVKVPAKSIAVLPFENLSEDKANAYFAEGIQEEILTRLAKIADLKVISRTSTQRYQSKPVNLSEIAKQLGVANILEGSVQKAADQVRVNVQLVNAQTRAVAIHSRKAALFRLAVPQAVDPIPARIHAERSLSPRVSSSQIVFMRSGVTTRFRPRLRVATALSGITTLRCVTLSRHASSCPIAAGLLNRWPI
jgi:TolB-like protein